MTLLAVRARPIVVLALLVAAASLGACSSDEGASTTSADVELSAAGQEGREVAEAQGCTSCHQQSGDEGIGPSWSGLAGSEVRLEDGSVVVADEAYLRTAITDPNAQVVEGYSGIMPVRNLDPADVDAIVAYLQDLGDRP